MGNYEFITINVKLIPSDTPKNKVNVFGRISTFPDDKTKCVEPKLSTNKSGVKVVASISTNINGIPKTTTKVVKLYIFESKPKVALQALKFNDPKRDYSISFKSIDEKGRSNPFTKSINDLIYYDAKTLIYHYNYEFDLLWNIQDIKTYPLVVWPLEKPLTGYPVGYFWGALGKSQKDILTIAIKDLHQDESSLNVPMQHYWVPSTVETHEIAHLMHFKKFFTTKI